MTPISMPGAREATILVVDDTPANVGLLVDHLEDNGFRTVVAQDGEDGLMRAQFVKPDMILLDVMMPGMDGFETCRRLKQIEGVKDIPVIFMTALTDTSQKVAGFGVGAVDYVTKPFQMDEVLARINTHLALRQATTELAGALQALKQTQEELVRSETLAALGSMMAGIAHELNTPIGNSLMVASTLQDQTRIFNKNFTDGDLKRSTLERYTEDAGKASDILVRNLYRAANLVASFKQAAVDQISSERRSFSLMEVVDETMLMLWPTLKKTPFVVNQNVRDELWMDSFPGPLGQVMTNLVNNALLHGFEGRAAGNITISARRIDNTWVELRFKDDGVGIAPANLDRVFEPFFTTKLGTGGSGLGLNIAHKLVTGVLGGQIIVESELGVGSCFVVTLPVSAPPQDALPDDPFRNREA